MVASEPGGRTVRPIEAGNTEGCDVIYAAPALVVPAESVALRVSDQPGFALDGGMVELKRRGARMGLVVNLGALESAGLKASSRKGLYQRATLIFYVFLLNVYFYQ